MRIFLIFDISLIFYNCLFAQNNQAVSEISGETLKGFTKNIFKYADFTEGKIFLKDGSEYGAKLNYNRVFGQITTIDRIGKAAPLSNIETLDKVTITNDTFYFFNNNVLEKITHFGNGNLYLKQTMVYVVEQKDGYNGTPDVISDASKKIYDAEPKKEDVNIEKNSQFKVINEYFIADQSMNFISANKKNFYDLFADHKEELKTFLREHSTDFSNINQMEKLLQYMNNL